MNPPGHDIGNGLASGYGDHAVTRSAINTGLSVM
jgi:hypothetical protein